MNPELSKQGIFRSKQLYNLENIVYVYICNAEDLVQFKK